jgi:hypothetical protein
MVVTFTTASSSLRQRAFAIESSCHVYIVEVPRRDGEKSKTRKNNAEP